MCDTADDGVGISNSVPNEERLERLGLRSADLSKLMPVARELANWRENRDSHIGFVGYNKTVPGNKVLIAVDREYDQAVPNAVAAALREKGAHVDILTADMGDPDREFDYLDEIEVIMRREPWDKNPRRWEGMPYIEDFALRRGYDLLIHGKGGPIPKTDFRYEQIPWLRPEHFLQRRRPIRWTYICSSTKKPGTRFGSMDAAGERDSRMPRVRIFHGPIGMSTMTARAMGFPRHPAMAISLAIRCRRSSPKRMLRVWLPERRVIFRGRFPRSKSNWKADRS